MAPSPLRYRDDAADDRLAGARSLAAYLPRILAYPLTGFCLPVLVLTSLLIVVRSQGLAGVPLLAIGTIWMLHYLLTVIERTAQGHATTPPLVGEVVFLDGWKTFKTLSGPLLVATLYVALRGRAPHAALALLMAASFLLPAYLFLLATDGSLPGALNPLQWWRSIAGMGMAYLLPCAMLALSVLLLSRVAHRANLALLTFAVGYTAVATAHLLGFVAYHRHRQLDLDVRVGDPEDKRRQQEQSRRLEGVLAAIDAQLRAADLAAAVAALRAEPGGPASRRGFHEDLFERLSTRGVPELLHEQGRRLIEVLLAEKRDGRALEVFETCENRHPGFEPASAASGLRLAREALQARLFARFEQLVERLMTADPLDPHAVSAAFLRARDCSERLGDDARALELLQPLLAQERHPEHAQFVALARALQGVHRRPPA